MLGATVAALATLPSPPQNHDDDDHDYHCFCHYHHCHHGRHHHHHQQQNNWWPMLCAHCTDYRTMNPMPSDTAASAFLEAAPSSNGSTTLPSRTMHNCRHFMDVQAWHSPRLLLCTFGLCFFSCALHSWSGEPWYAHKLRAAKPATQSLTEFLSRRPDLPDCGTNKQNHPQQQEQQQKMTCLSRPRVKANDG